MDKSAQPPPTGTKPAAAPGAGARGVSLSENNMDTEVHRSIYEQGYEMRKKVVGEDYVERTLANGSSDFMRPLQQFATVGFDYSFFQFYLIIFGTIYFSQDNWASISYHQQRFSLNSIFLYWVIIRCVRISILGCMCHDDLYFKPPRCYSRAIAPSR